VVTRDGLVVDEAGLIAQHVGEVRVDAMCDLVDHGAVSPTVVFVGLSTVVMRGAAGGLRCGGRPAAVAMERPREPTGQAIGEPVSAA
jgi:hypothetical protein